MMPNHVWRKSACGNAPDSGAIFMSNRRTMDECFERQLFGLPHAFSEFVKIVKAGMVLFLFEYEQRKLYGVFRAVSDGRMDIAPSAYHSSGRKFPAQVQFSVIWNCHPLSEHEFHDAIRENYFAARKFNIGLSKHQVQRLLYLFHSRMIRVQNSLRKKKVKKTCRNASDKAYPLGDSLENSVVESQPMNLVDIPQALNERTSIFQHPFTSGTSNLLPSMHEYTVHSSDALASLCFSGRQTAPSRREPEHIDVSSYTTSSVLGDYIPLSSPEQFEPTETAQAFSEAPCDGHKDLSIDEACIFPRFFGVRESNQPSSVLYADRDNCDESSVVHQGENYPRVKGLYSDISDIKASVFSRLKLESKASVEKNENSEMTESVHDIMKKLQLSRKIWEKAAREIKSDTLKNRFPHLSAASEHVERKDVCAHLDELANRAVESFSRKNIKRGREVCIKQYGDVNNWNTWSSEAWGNGHIDGAVGGCLSEKKQEKARLVSVIVKEEFNVNTETFDRWSREVQMPPQESPAGKENAGSCEGSAKSDKTGDNKLVFSGKEMVSAVIGPGPLVRGMAKSNGRA